MPPRSVLLNVSITSKGLEKDRVVESVKEVAAQAELQHGSFEAITPVMEEGKHERADSAVSGRFLRSFLLFLLPGGRMKMVRRYMQPCLDAILIRPPCSLRLFLHYFSTLHPHPTFDGAIA